jgi:hypothetical protein
MDPTALMLSATTKKSLSRLYSQMSQTQNGASGALQHDMDRSKSAVIPFSSRLLEGRALAQDVWSIFKYAQFPVFRCFPYQMLQCSQSAIRLLEPRPRLHELRASEMGHNCC